MLVLKLNDIHEYLWYCAKEPNVLPLHEQLMEKVQIVVTEQVNLQLICPTKTNFCQALAKVSALQ
jgi:hypothetical protein